VLLILGSNVLAATVNLLSISVLPVVRLFGMMMICSWSLFSMKTGLLLMSENPGLFADWRALVLYFLLLFCLYCLVVGLWFGVRWILKLLG
jgi:hypothetical protein